MERRADWKKESDGWWGTAEKWIKKIDSAYR